MSPTDTSILASDWGGLRQDLETTRQSTAKGERVLVRHPETGKVSIFSVAAFDVLKVLKPGRPAFQSIAENVRGGVEHAPSTAALVAYAHSAGLLVGGEVAAPVEQQPNAIERVARFNPFCFQIPLFNPDRAARLLRPVTAVLFSVPVVALWMIAMLGGFVLLWVQWNAYGVELHVFKRFAWWPIIYVLLIASALLHEFGHVLVCHRFGVRVREVGVLIYLFHPAAYADVSGAWMLPERWKRVAVALAGIYVESILWLLATATWALTGPGAIHEIAFVTGACLSWRIVVNLIPFLRFDGYWVLSDWAGMPNLRPRAFAHLASLIPGAGKRWAPAGTISRKESALLLSYASMALVCFVGALSGSVQVIRSILHTHLPALSGPLSLSIAVVVLALATANVWMSIARPQGRARG